MDNKKRLALIKKHAAGSQSVKDLQSAEIAEAIHGLSHKDASATHQESVETTQYFAAAVHKHIPSSVIKTELTALQAALVHEKESVGGVLTQLEDAIQKKIIASHHLPEEASAYMLLAKLSTFSRTVLFGQ